MATYYEIPTRTDLGVYTVTTEIEGSDFIFKFWFNERDGFWYVDLYDSDFSLLVSGRKIVLGTYLFTPTMAEGMPTVPIYASSTDGVDAGLDDLGNLVRLIFEVA